MCNFLSIGYAAAMQSCIVNSVMNEGNEKIVEVVVKVNGNVEDRDDGEI